MIIFIILSYITWVIICLVGPFALLSWSHKMDQKIKNK